MAAERSWPRLRSMMRVRDGSPKGDAFSRLRAWHDSPPARLRAGTPVPIYPCVTPTLSLAGIRKLGARFLWHGCMPARPEPLSDNQRRAERGRRRRVGNTAQTTGTTRITRRVWRKASPPRVRGRRAAENSQVRIFPHRIPHPTTASCLRRAGVSSRKRRGWCACSAVSYQRFMNGSQNAWQIHARGDR
jgi:hypothetical protein